jgi:hypothetical protein
MQLLVSLAWRGVAWRGVQRKSIALPLSCLPFRDRLLLTHHALELNLSLYLGVDPRDSRLSDINITMRSSASIQYYRQAMHGEESP